MKPLTRKTLYDWYEHEGRKNLPWRLTDDPYHIYLSEVMLQQTQVKTVLERFYFPFLKKFPTLTSVAKADVADVLKAWQGLGYYSRARYLHQTAQMTAPTLPDDVGALEKLPGIGKNTAHAIAAFAYQKSVPVMEANVKRVVARFFAFKHPTTKELWDGAWHLLDSTNPFTHNQAMMDIGAMVCTNNTPHCKNCPLQRECSGKNQPEHYPQKKVKKAVPTRHYQFWLHYTNDYKLYLAPRTTRFLNGMYQFDQHNINVSIPQSAIAIGNITHQYSHFRLKADIYALPSQKKGYHYTRQEINHLPLSGTDEKALQRWDDWINNR
ncbi:MAG: A/G-specific adenine glycosylase [Rickettsiales bacterium]|nr:A/G-specific adenine glycosylase [Rickettsiales bacterium]